MKSKIAFLYLSVLLLFGLHASGQNMDVIIISDVGGSFPGPTGTTTAKWDSAASIMSYTDTVVGQTYLDSTAFLNTSKALVITNATLSNIDFTQVIAYAKLGKSVYIQSKDDTTSLGNQAFSKVVDSLGGHFVWGKSFSSNKGRTIIGSLQYLPQNVMYCTPAGVCKPITTTDYNGAVSKSFSCEVLPFLVDSDVTLNATGWVTTGWMFTPQNASYGRIISATSTSWMTHGTALTYPTVIYPLLSNILFHLVNRHQGDSTSDKYNTVHQTICASQLPYSWNGQSITHGGIAAGTFTGSTSIGCDSTVTLNLTVNPVYKDTVTFFICPDLLPYNWNGIVVPAAGNAVATYHTNSALGCDSTVTLSLHLLPVYNDTIARSICSVQLPYAWNGYTINTIGDFNLTYKTHSFTYGCDSAITLHLTALPIPDFEISNPQPGLNRNYCIDDTIQITASGNATRYEWSMGNVLQATNNPALLKLTQANNLVTVTGFNTLGCSVTKNIAIDAQNCCGISIPSAFSPNGDGLNDKFGAFSIGHPTAYQMVIYDRWGQLVFASSNINSMWDGTFKGRNAEAGTYFYQIRSECINGSRYEKRGDITLVR